VITIQGSSNTTNENETSNNEATIALPPTHTIIQKSKLGMLNKEATTFHLFMNQFSNKCYIGNDGGDLMLGFATLIVLQFGYLGFSTAIPFLIGSLFANDSVPISSVLLVSSQPSDITLQRLVRQNDVHTFLLVQDSIRKYKYVYISADKGNNKGNKHCKIHLLVRYG